MISRERFRVLGKGLVRQPIRAAQARKMENEATGARAGRGRAPGAANPAGRADHGALRRSHRGRGPGARWPRSTIWPRRSAPPTVLCGGRERNGSERGVRSHARSRVRRRSLGRRCARFATGSIALGAPTLPDGPVLAAWKVMVTWATDRAEVRDAELPAARDAATAKPPEDLEEMISSLETDSQQRMSRCRR